tara:strand:- start:12126 stop:14471 length:2346 start_codon:yes stop_codon:yes gene_type:complete
MSSTKTLSIFLKLNSKEFTTGIKKIEGKLGKFSKRLDRIGSSLTRNLTLPLLAVGASSVKAASDFEASMTKIQTLVGTSASDVNKLRESVLQLSGKTATAPRELAEGLFFIQSAGFKGKASLDALEVSAKASAIKMGDMKDIANALTSMMTGYAKENMTAVRAGDLLHETLKQGKFEAADFMDKIGTVIPTAAAFGISFEQLGASVATMSRLSGDAASSLTAVNRLMMSLNAPAEQQSKILKDVFGSYDNLAESLKKDFAGTLGIIFKALEGNNKELTKVFGSTKAVKAAFSTAGLQAETYSEVLDKMDKSLGNVNNGLNIASETAEFKFQQSLVDLGVASIRLGDTLKPVATKIATWISKMANRFSRLSSETVEKISKIGLALLALGPSILILGKIASMFKYLLVLVRLLIPTLLAVGRFFMALTPFGRIITLIAAAIGLMASQWDKTKEMMVKVINLVIGLANTFITLKDVMVEAVIFGFKFFVEKSKLYLNLIGGFFEGLGNVIIDVLSFNDPRESFKKFKDGLKADIDDSADATAKAWDKAMDKIKSDDNKLGLLEVEDINNMEGKLLDTFQSMFDKVGNMWGDTFKGGGGGGDFDIGDGLGGEIPEFEDIETGWGNMLKSMKDMTTEFFEGFDERFADMVANTIAEGRNLAEGFKGFVKEIIKEMTRLIVKMLVMKAIMAIINPAGTAATAVADVGSSVAGFAKGGLVTGPTLAMVGEGSGTTLSNPEVIAPLDTLRGMMGGPSRLSGRIQGADILLSSDRSTDSRYRVSGSVTDF